MESMFQDLRFAARTLLRSRGFTLAAVATLALGIGGNTAIFSVVDAVLLGSLPFPEPDRLVMVWSDNQREGISEDISSYPNFTDWRAQSRSFEAMAAVRGGVANLTGDGDAQEVFGSFVTEDFFRVLGVEPVLGRAFVEAEHVPDGPAVAVLGHGLWTRRFGADPSIVGKSITLDGQPVTVVGVMPDGTGYPRAAELWRPLAPTGQLRESRGALWLEVVGRLRPGISVERAQEEMTTIASRLETEYEGPNEGMGVALEPMMEAEVGDVRTALLLLLGAVGFVLLIACVNVANLLLARGIARRKEVAVRLAVGAEPRRIVRLMLAESTLLGLAGGAVGLVLAAWAVASLPALAPPELPRLDAIRLDGSVLAFAAVISLLTGLLFGLVPALQVVRPELTQALKEGGRGSSSGRGQRRLRPLLVAGEVALAVVLLAGAGLMLRSFAELQSVDTGLRPEGVLTARVTLPATSYPDGPSRRAFFRSVLENVRGTPGVQEAGAGSSVLLSRLPNMSPISVESRPDLPSAIANASVTLDAVTPGFFDALGIQLLSGRPFDERDHAEATPVAIVNRATARRYFEDRSPIGERVTFGDPQDTAATWLTIVGVVQDVRRSGLALEPRPELYAPYEQYAPRSMRLVARGAGEAGALAGVLRRAVAAVDADQPLAEVEPLPGLLARTVAERRFLMLLLVAFGATAALLAAIGIYGVMAYLVGQRRRELAMRLALGAERSHLLALVLRQGLKQVALGLVPGVLGALALTRLLEGQLFGVSATDLPTFAGVVALFSGVALLASLLPARRAAGVDPMVSMREE